MTDLILLLLNEKKVKKEIVNAISLTPDLPLYYVRNESVNGFNHKWLTGVLEVPVS